MTITLADIRKHESPQSKDSRYSPEDNQVSFELSLMSSIERGEIFEAIIAERIQKHTGYQATQTVHRAHWDITVNLDDSPVRIEVKSSLMGKGEWNKHKRAQFLLQNIKPDNFDYLFIVLIKKNDVMIKWCTADDMQLYFDDNLTNEQTNGYNVSIVENRQRVKSSALDLDMFYDLEDFPVNPKDFA